MSARKAREAWARRHGLDDFVCLGRQRRAQEAGSNSIYRRFYGPDAVRKAQRDEREGDG